MCSPRAVFTHIPAAPLTALSSDGSPIACPPSPQCPAFKHCVRLTQSKQRLSSTWQCWARGVCLTHPRKPTTKGLRNSDKYKIFLEQPKGPSETPNIISLQGLSLYREWGGSLFRPSKREPDDFLETDFITLFSKYHHYVTKKSSWFTCDLDIQACPSHFQLLILDLLGWYHGFIFHWFFWLASMTIASFINMNIQMVTGIKAKATPL